MRNLIFVFFIIAALIQITLSGPIGPNKKGPTRQPSVNHKQDRSNGNIDDEDFLGSSEELDEDDPDTIVENLSDGTVVYTRTKGGVQKMIRFDSEGKIMMEKNNRTGIEKTSVINDNGNKMKIIRDTNRGIVRTHIADMEGRTCETRNDPSYTRYRLDGENGRYFKTLMSKITGESTATIVEENGQKVELFNDKKKGTHEITAVPTDGRTVKVSKGRDGIVRRKEISLPRNRRMAGAAKTHNGGRGRMKAKYERNESDFDDETLGNLNYEKSHRKGSRSGRGKREKYFSRQDTLDGGVVDDVDVQF